MFAWKMLVGVVGFTLLMLVPVALIIVIAVLVGFYGFLYLIGVTLWTSERKDR